MKIGTIILFLFTIKLSAQTTTRDQFINPTGTYILKGLLVKNNITGHSGELRVKLIESKNKVALAFYINNGYPGYESGSFVDTVNYSENQALYKPPSDHDCTIIFSFSVKNAEIQQIYVDPDCTCGFAKGILASSLFRKYSSEIPVIQDLSGHGISH